MGWKEDGPLPEDDEGREVIGTVDTGPTDVGDVGERRVECKADLTEV